MNPTKRRRAKGEDHRNETANTAKSEPTEYNRAEETLYESVHKLERRAQPPARPSPAWLAALGTPLRQAQRFRHFHPMMLEEMVHMVSEEGDDPIALLMLAGVLRDDFPWLAELMAETYREIREGDPRNNQRTIERLRRVVKNLGRRDFIMEFTGPSKDAHMLAMELPRMLDHLLHRLEVRRGMAPNDDPESAEGTKVKGVS